MINVMNQCQFDDTLNKLQNIMIINTTNDESSVESSPPPTQSTQVLPQPSLVSSQSQDQIQEDKELQESNDETKDIDCQQELANEDSNNCLYPDNAGVNTEEFIKKTLIEHAKDRLFMLNVEKILTDFVNNDKLQYYKFQAMNPYQRMLVHRIGAYFCLGHNVDQETKQCVIVTKTDKSRVPSIKFQTLIPQNEQNQQQQQQQLQIPVQQQQQLILQTSLQETTHQQQQQQHQQKQILKREKPLDTNQETIGQNRINSNSKPNEMIRTKTFEEKSAEYLKAKNRIFNGNDTSTGLNDINNKACNNKNDKIITHSLSTSNLIKSTNNNFNKQSIKLSSSTTVNTSFQPTQQQQQQQPHQHHQSFTILNRTQALNSLKQQQQAQNEQFIKQGNIFMPHQPQLQQHQQQIQFNYLHTQNGQVYYPYNPYYMHQIHAPPTHQATLATAHPSLQQQPPPTQATQQQQQQHQNYVPYESQNGQHSSQYIYQQVNPMQQYHTIPQQHHHQIPLNQYFQSNNSTQKQDNNNRRQQKHHHQQNYNQNRYQNNNQNKQSFQQQSQQQQYYNKSNGTNNYSKNNVKYQQRSSSKVKFTPQTSEPLLQVYDFNPSLLASQLINDIRQMDNSIQIKFIRLNDMSEIDEHSLVNDLNINDSNLLVLIKPSSIENLNKILALQQQQLQEQSNNFKIKHYNNDKN